MKGIKCLKRRTIMNFACSLVIILILAGLFVLMYVIGGIIDALERYICSRRRRDVKETSESFRRV